MVQTQTTIHNLLLYSTTIVVSNSQNHGNTCPLKCRNGSECKPGDASFEGHPTDVNGNELEHHTVTNVQNHHCECPIGYTGVDCSVVYESCADGSHVCYNQGSCVTGKVDGFGNEQYHCDCTNAFYREDKDLIIRFVGKYCEYPEETLCDDGKMFCVNNGVCATAGATSENTTCNCTSGFQGLHCEFREEEVPPCDLKCQNGGSCQVGLPPNANSDGAVDSQFCECPPEHSGDLCEVWATNRQQYPTAMCAASDIETTIYQGFASLSFCVNDGVCTTIQEPDGRSYPGCICPENYEGMYCELLRSQTKQNGPDLATENGGDAGKIIICLVLSIILIAVLAMIRMRLLETRTLKRSKAMIQEPHTREDASESSVVKEEKFKDEILENVELL